MAKSPSAAVKRLWKNPQYRKHQTAIRKKLGNTVVVRVQNKKIAQAAWDDPEKRKAMIKRRKSSYTSARLKKMSDACIGRKPWNKGLTKDTDSRLLLISKKNSGKIPDYGKMRAWYQNGDIKILMRSRWEVAFAQYLDRREIEWQYEPRHFDVGRGIWMGESYIPDFYLPFYSLYVEIKGRYDKACEAKYDRFCKLYPDVRWKLFTRTKLRELGVINAHGIAQLQ